jgi:SAM-dependent methyltransferase
MLDPKDLDYFNYGKIENEKFWRRLGGKPNLENKSILDFGCGHGSLCIEMAKKNVNSILGIDLNEKLIKFANINLEKNFSNFKNKVSFEEKDLLNENFNEKFDIIVTKDTFEHSENLPQILEKFYSILNKGGKVLAGFGPLYNFYNGDHGRTQLKLPWLHVLLPEKFIINRYNKKNQKQIKRIEDLGLSKYSFAEYQKIFSESKFDVEYFVTNKSDHPVSLIFNILSKIKYLSEFFTYNIYCILKKN